MLHPLGAALGVVLLVASAPLAAQGAPALPRTAAGKPDLSRICQAMTTANCDVEPHDARPAMAMRPGPVVPVPAKEVVALGADSSGLLCREADVRAAEQDAVEPEP